MHVQYDQLLTAYLQEEQNTVEQMDLDVGYSNDDIATFSHIPPSGEEGFNLSHEGGEYEVFESLVEDIAQATG